MQFIDFVYDLCNNAVNVSDRTAPVACSGIARFLTPGASNHNGRL
jgi:hypothetical protein